MNDKKNVSVAKPKVGGALWRAPFGTTLPTDAVTELDEAFKCLGYLSEEGITNGLNKSYEQTKAFGGDIVDNYLSESSDTFGYTMIESLNIEALKAVYGDENVSGTIEEGISVNVDLGDQDEYSWVAEMIFKNKVLKRIVVPAAKITELGDVVYNSSTAVGYPATMSATKDANGRYHYEYMKKKSE